MYENKFRYSKAALKQWKRLDDTIGLGSCRELLVETYKNGQNHAIRSMLPTVFMIGFISVACAVIGSIMGRD